MVDAREGISQGFVKRDRRAMWIRPAVQFGFAFFAVLLCIEFRGFILSLGDPGRAVPPRPAAVDAYLPISSLLSLTYFFKTGIINDVRPAGLVIFSLTLVLAIAVRRGFCSWACPFGTAAEYAHRAGRWLFGGNIVPPKWIDVPLQSLKYLLLGFFVYQIARMPAEGLHGFIHGSYNRIADVKMYLFFSNISAIGIAVLAVLGVLSLLIKNFWCRYLCPYGALLGLFSLVSPTAVRRDKAACVGCGACTKACPNRIAVDRKESVRSTLCTACMSCIHVCKVAGALELGGVKKKLRFSATSYALITVLAFLVAAQAARSAGYWHSSTTPQFYRMLYSRISQIAHP
ncbi:MAG: 4Fe-4S binding protein [Phycisphaerae bacterium]|nr:4Fe-4S binding protein [Phycisphaerae bacterium]